MDDIEFEDAIRKLKCGSVQDFSVEEMQFYCSGFERAICKKQKERLQFTRETRNAYNMGYNHGKAKDEFLMIGFRKRLNNLN
jgi:hypothetical protein